jgi:hypothetical protein
MVGEIAIDVDQSLVVRAPKPEVSPGQPDALCGAVGEAYLFPDSKAIEGELQGRGTAVETQDDLACRCRIGRHRLSSQTFGNTTSGRHPLPTATLG